MTNKENLCISRKCPECGKELFYTNKINCKKAKEKNSYCYSCSALNRNSNKEAITKKNTYYRVCRQCNKDISYKTYKTWHQANKRNSVCSTCKKKNSKIIGNKKEFKLNHSRMFSGSKNPMFGKTYYERWVEKFGKDAADKLQFKRNASAKRLTGKDHPMYGKPPSRNTGRGWSGWYHGIYFRSILELSYMIWLDKNKIIWESAENDKFKIEYLDENNISHCYFPDFFINNDTIVECKPKWLHKSKTVQLKAIAAKRFCILNSYKYLLTDVEKLSNSEIKLLHDTGKIVFTDRFEIKFKQKYLRYEIKSS